MRPPPFQAFLDGHREDVHRFLVALVGPQEAEDCFQETFLAALRAYPRLREASNLRAWVLTIAHRKAMDAHRARRRRPEPVGIPPEGAGEHEERPETETWALVRELPPKQRGAVALRFAADLPYREIAAALRCSEEAARQSVRAGLRRLREVMER